MPDDNPNFDLEDLLNPDEQHRFRKLCLPTSVEELAQLPAVVELHLDQVRQVRMANTDVETADAIGAALLALLREQNGFDDEQRALIRGAVEYFLLADDAAGDLDDVLGFDDDARVVNSMLTRIGLPQYRIELG
ncbi:MAG: hypothetical protein AAFN30_02850 [Actinomycetota bacterium]